MAIGRDIGQARAQLGARVPDHRLAQGRALGDLQPVRAVVQKQRSGGRGEHAVVLAREGDGALLRVAHILHGVPARTAVQALQAHLCDVVHAQVAVQGDGEVPGHGAGVAHGAIDPQPAGRQHHIHPRGKGVRPPGAGALVVGQVQRQAHGAGLGLRVLGAPRQVARETVLGQRAALVELRETQRNAAPDGGLAVEHGVRAQVEALAPAGNPGQHLGAVQRHQRGIAVADIQANAGLPAIGIKHASDPEPHALCWERMPYTQ